MRTTTLALAAPAACALALMGASGAVADGHHHGGSGASGSHASSGHATYTMHLKDTMGNNSGSSSTATIKVKGDQLWVHITGTGFTPNSPHAQHFHGSFDGSKNFTCPTSSADKDGDGQVNVEEGLPMYGDIVLSLTTKGDTSPDSGLAVDRMPTADADGNLDYTRTIDLPKGSGDKLKNLHIVQHGLDANGNDKYDLDALGESTFAKSLGVNGIPEEATNPATCGTVSGASVGSAPTGGVDTGDGTTSGIENAGLLGLGATLLIGGGGAWAYQRRLDRQS
ncbi:hypothetical protein [Luteipulveratus halotolerans]|uniref:CHRD domain-containing protein n=1 Tax=Luteipulveratus halotolerans TaxID=1631356 RepID=A0A0L6CMU5_9MICO|nr:hypothetical protein [Luteipulveratus halotolerans]KNX39059.1 hypothetical protein VV01_21105 [Luteipulveratus halotolerans]